MTKKSTAIVLLNYNAVDYLQQFLPTLVQQTPNWATIYVIDNASTDQSKRFVQQQYKHIQWIQLEENYGYAGGYFHGLKQINEDYWVLLNSDVEVTKNWLEPLISRFEQESDLAAIQPKIKSFAKRDYFEHAGAAGGYIDFLGYPFCRGRLFDVEENDSGQYDQYAECFWASGACMAIKKSAYEQAGGFDPRFFMHMEEIDLCWRLQRLGFRVACEPQSTVYHVGGASLPYESPKKFYYNFRNNLILLQKNLPTSKFVYVLLFRLILDGVAALRELTLGKLGHTGAIFNAWLSYTKGYFSWKKKYNISSYHTIKTIYTQSILWDFFFLNHKKYSSLRHENTHRRS